MTDSDQNGLSESLRRALADAPRRETALSRLRAVWPQVKEARAASVGWAEIGLRLASVGITRADGRPFSPATLVWAMGRLEGRKRAQGEAVTRFTASTPAPKLATPATPAPSHPPPRPPTNQTAFQVPEVDALFEVPADVPPALTVDDFLKGKTNEP